MPERCPTPPFGEYVRPGPSSSATARAASCPSSAGLILLVIIFQVQDSVFLSAGNLTNLLVQGSVFVLLGMAEIWVLILGEIDLSVGYVAGIGGAITAILARPAAQPPVVGRHPRAAWRPPRPSARSGGPWSSGCACRRSWSPWPACSASEGVLLYLVNANGTGGTIRITDSVLLDIANGNLSPTAGWIVVIISVVLFGGAHHRAGPASPGAAVWWPRRWPSRC